MLLHEPFRYKAHIVALLILTVRAKYIRGPKAFLRAVNQYDNEFWAREGVGKTDLFEFRTRDLGD